ncbi:MAG TPA: hypothetical protein VMT52_16050 [Planctomycetota bacterium]|nr:hypothetical protein [Planctomycetota bacterium]
MSNAEDRRLSSITRPHTLAALAVCLAVAVLFGARGEAVAGSVFMKNGYIIQAPIVERNDGGIVLGWPNGKVQIYRRFIESITYDMGEEKQLQDAEIQSKEAEAGAARLDILASEAEPEDLPTSLEQVLEKYKDVVKAPSPEAAADHLLVERVLGVRSPSDRVLDPGLGEVGVLSRPDESLEPRVTEESLGVSFQPPRGWVTRSTNSAFQAVGASGTDGFRPSISVVTMPAGDLPREEYVTLLKDEISKNLQDFEFLSEGPRQIGGETAYEVVGRGTRHGRAAVLRQVVIVKGGQVWLVSAFASPADQAATASIIGESVKTFEFTSP